eukprot:PLAT13523.2.p1 GENE.PLAT13523.2~~PLAT13523.2.p1  ORF type:complete len:489 (+),score=105.59 PLAT13523.2:132-1469(+)
MAVLLPAPRRARPRARRAAGWPEADGRSLSGPPAVAALLRRVSSSSHGSTYCAACEHDDERGCMCEALLAGEAGELSLLRSVDGEAYRRLLLESPASSDGCSSSASSSSADEGGDDGVTVRRLQDDGAVVPGPWPLLPEELLLEVLALCDAATAASALAACKSWWRTDCERLWRGMALSYGWLLVEDDGDDDDEDAGRFGSSIASATTSAAAAADGSEREAILRQRPISPLPIEACPTLKEQFTRRFYRELTWRLRLHRALPALGGCNRSFTVVLCGSHDTHISRSQLLWAIGRELIPCRVSFTRHLEGSTGGGRGGAGSDASAAADYGGGSVQIDVVDTPGHSDYYKHRIADYASADAVVLCYSAASAASFAAVHSRFYPELLRHAPGLPLLLLGLKPVSRDALARERGVCEVDAPLLPHSLPGCITWEEGASMAREIGARAFF